MGHRQSLVLKLISSTFISDVYCLMWSVLYLIFVATHCNVIVPLINHCIIKNGPLHGVLYSYVALLLSMTFSPTF